MDIIIALVAGMTIASVITLILCKSSASQKTGFLEEKIMGLKKELIARNLEGRAIGDKISFFENEVKHHRDLAVMLPGLVKQVLSARSTSEATEYTVRAINLLTGTEKIALFLADRMGSKLGLANVKGLEKILTPPLVLNVGEGHIGIAAETGKVLSREDFANESVLVKQQVERTAIPNYIPDLVAPMTFQGVLYGVVCMNEIPSSASLVKERVRAIANVSASVLENIRLLERFETAADLDMDTGLPGPTQLLLLLETELERLSRFNSPLTIIDVRIISAATSDKFLSREIMRMSAIYLKNTMRNIDIGIKTGPENLMLLLPGTDITGTGMVIEKLASTMPDLTNEDGDTVGAIELRRISLQPGRNYTSEDVMDLLGQKEFERFG